MFTLNKAHAFSKKRSIPLFSACLVVVILFFLCLQSSQTINAKEDKNVQISIEGNGIASVTLNEFKEPIIISSNQTTSIFMEQGESILLEAIANERTSIANILVDGISVIHESKETNQMAYRFEKQTNTPNISKITIIFQPIDLSQLDENDSFGTIQVQRKATKPSSIPLSDIFFGIYLKKDINTQINGKYLVANEDGLTNQIKLATGTYYIRQEIGGGYTNNLNFHEVTIQKNQNTLIEIPCTPVLPEIQLFGFTKAKEITYLSRLTDAPMSCAAEQNGIWLWCQDTQVYCISPGIIFKPDKHYTASTLRPWYISENTAKKLAIVNYYGTRYDKNRGPRYRAAAQSLIWEILYNESTDDAVRTYGNANNRYIYQYEGTSVKPEMNVISYGLEHHYDLPSFNHQTFNLKAGEELTLKDTNCFYKYSTSANDQIVQTKNGSEWKIKVKETVQPGTKIRLSYQFLADSQDGQTIYYRSQGFQEGNYWSGWQLCADFYIPDYPSGYIDIVVEDSYGELTLKKTSAQPELSEGNSCYSIAEAQYELYEDVSCLKSIGTFITKQDGFSNTLKLKTGTYYLKEIKAPVGFSLDFQIHQVNVLKNQLTTFQIQDLPQYQPISVLLEKKDANTLLPLSNAEYLFKFYAKKYDTGVDPATIHEQPTRTWLLRTLENGQITFSDECKVSGDDFYIDKDNNSILPMGTLTIQEYKAPSGYHLDSSIYVKNIYSVNDNEQISIYNHPIIMENPIVLKILKQEKYSQLPISNVTFSHTMPDGSTSVYTTNQKGEVILTGLSAGKHIIVENEAPSIYCMNPNPFEFEINEDGDICLLSDDLESKDFIFTKDDLGNGQWIIFNNIQPYNLAIHKMNNENNYLSGAEFSLYSDSQLKTLISKQSTNQNGIIIFDGLKYKQTYYLKETKAPDGYRLDSTIHTIKVDDVSPCSQIFKYQINDINYTHQTTSPNVFLESTINQYTIHLSLTNQIQTQLPETGSSMYILIEVIILIIFVLGMIIFKKTCKEME